MKQFNLQLAFGTICVTIGNGYASITSTIEREKCPYCGKPDCDYDCDKSKERNDEEVVERLKFNFAVDCLESLVLAHASQGINVESNEYISGVNTTLEAIGNNQ